MQSRTENNNLKRFDAIVVTSFFFKLFFVRENSDDL